MSEEQKKVIKKRELIARERTELNFAKKKFSSVEKEKFNWIGVIVIAFLLLLLGLLATRYFRLLFPASVIIGGFYIRNRLQVFYDKKEEAKEKLKIIQQIEKTQQVEVITYQPERSIYFKDEGSDDGCYFLEVGKEELLVFWDFESEFIDVLPNSEVELYQGQGIEKVLGVGINPIGEHFEPTIIPQNILWDMDWNFDVFEETIVIPMSFDDLVLKIEKHLDKK